MTHEKYTELIGMCIDQREQRAQREQRDVASKWAEMTDMTLDPTSMMLALTVKKNLGISQRDQRDVGSH